MHDITRKRICALLEKKEYLFKIDQLNWRSVSFTNEKMRRVVHT